jgi:deazaflavin-dependent oxidoreductase (nitroreductase family)
MTQDRHPMGGGRKGRAFVRRVANPLVMALGLAGGRRSMWGVMEAPGRKSGQPRRNPVVPHVIGDIVLIPMSYGPDVAWVKNVMAAGGGKLRYKRRDWCLVEPRLVPFGTAAARLPERLAASYERMRVDAFLELRVEAGW